MELDVMIDNELKEIAEFLLRKENLPFSSGLIDGKMGVVVFYFHYAEYVKDETYKEYANSLIEDIQQDLTSNTSLNYNSGLAGIGAAIEYIVQQGFVEADTDEILSDFDEIFEKFLNDRTLYLSVSDIIDIGKYFQFRFCKKEVNPEIRKTIERLVYMYSLHMDVRPKYSQRAVDWLSGFSKKYYSEAITVLLKELSDVSAEKGFDSSLHSQMKAFTGLDILSQSDKRHLSWKELL